MNLGKLIEVLIILFIILVMGYISGKMGIFSKSMPKDISAMILSVTMPCLILSAALRSTGEPDFMKALWVLFLTIITYILLPLAGWIINRILRIPSDEHRVYYYMTTFSNVAYIGYPIVGALLGNEMIIYASVSSLIFNLLNFTLGAHWMSGGRERQSAIKVVLSPGVITSVVAILIFFASIKMPEILTQSIQNVGDMTTPLAMIVIGLNLASIRAKKIFGHGKVYFFVIIRMIFVPILLWLLYRQIAPTKQLVILMTVISALPVATAGVLFANRFDYHVETTTAGVFLTTLACLVTIPFLIFLLFVWI